MKKLRTIIYQNVTAWVDGSSKGNPGAGGYGIVLRHQKTGAAKHIAGAAPSSTNNQMELYAAIHALESLKTPCVVTLYTDSQYLASGWNEWLEDWIAHNWRTSRNKPVRNFELWQRLVKIAKTHIVTLVWVKGHNGEPGNEKAHELASKAADYHATTGKIGPWVSRAQ